MRKRALQISGSRSTILLDGVLRHLDAVAELDVAGGGHAGRQAVDAMKPLEDFWSKLSPES